MEQYHISDSVCSVYSDSDDLFPAGEEQYVPEEEEKRCMVIYIVCMMYSDPIAARIDTTLLWRNLQKRMVETVDVLMIRSSSY